MLSSWVAPTAARPLPIGGAAPKEHRRSDLRGASVVAANALTWPNIGGTHKDDIVRAALRQVAANLHTGLGCGGLRLAESSEWRKQPRGLGEDNEHNKCGTNGMAQVPP